MTRRQNRVWAELKLPTKVPDYIIAVRGILEAGNELQLPGAAPVLAQLAVALDELDEAHVASQAGTRGTIPARDAKQNVVRSILNEYRAVVQKAADANPEEAASLIERARLFVRAPSSREKVPFEAENGSVSGQAKLAVLSAGDNATYYFEFSPNGGKTWNGRPGVKQAETTIDGLPIGEVVQFRYRALTRAGTSDWSDVISLLIK